MATTKLKKFLIGAKLHTYAAGGENKAMVLSSGEKEYIYEKDNLKYIDRYNGHEKFYGEENIFADNKLIWKMGYEGEIVSNVVSPDDIYDFLKKALRLVPGDKPFRGPQEYIEKDFEYTNEIKGNMEKFSGVEKIFYKNELAYRLIYNGKMIN
jgi:hypothetical protein